jgi:hypothetical protein
MTHSQQQATPRKRRMAMQLTMGQILDNVTYLNSFEIRGLKGSAQGDD